MGLGPSIPMTLSLRRIGPLFHERHGALGSHGHDRADAHDGQEGKSEEQLDESVGRPASLRCRLAALSALAEDGDNGAGLVSRLYIADGAVEVVTLVSKLPNELQSLRVGVGELLAGSWQCHQPNAAGCGRRRSGANGRLREEAEADAEKEEEAGERAEANGEAAAGLLKGIYAPNRRCRRTLSHRLKLALLALDLEQRRVR